MGMFSLVPVKNGQKVRIYWTCQNVRLPRPAPPPPHLKISFLSQLVLPQALIFLAFASHEGKNWDANLIFYWPHVLSAVGPGIFKKRRPRYI